MKDPKDLRADPRTRQLAMLASTHDPAVPWAPAEVRELNDLGEQLIEEAVPTDLAELARVFHEDDAHPENRAELVRSAREVLKVPVHPMSRNRILGVGLYLTGLGLAVLAVIPWAWSMAVDAMTADAAAPRPVRHFLGVAFTPTAEFALVLIVILMAVVGSVAVLLMTFANRAGHETLEHGFLWWYLTRPLAAAAVGVLFYMTVVAGYFNQTSGKGRAALLVAAAVGGLAGLFTDQVLTKMRGVLGQTRFEATAADAKAKAKAKAD